MRIDNPSVSGSISFITGTNQILSSSAELSGSFTGSFIGDGSGLTGISADTSTTASYVDYTDIANKPTLLSGSSQIASDISGSFTSVSQSFASTIENTLIKNNEEFQVIQSNTPGATGLKFINTSSGTGVSTTLQLQSDTGLFTIYNYSTGNPDNPYRGGQIWFGNTGGNGFVFDDDVDVDGNVTADSFIGDGSGLTGISADTSTTASYVDFSNIGNLPTLISSSNQLAGQTIDGELTVTGKLTAQEFHTEFVSSSIIFESGSTKFGDSADDNHDFTGSLNVSGSTHHMFGNIGIGTTTPFYPLDIVYNDNNSPNRSGVSIINSVLNSESKLTLGARSGAGNILRTEIGFDSNTFNLNFYNQTSSETYPGTTPAMSINQFGNVGIGSTTPSSKLEVTGNVAIGYTSAAPANGMIVAGNVGIGTISPTEMLDVNGNVKATSFIGSGASLTSLNASNITTGTLADARLSSNVALKNVDNNFSVGQTINGDLITDSVTIPNGEFYNSRRSSGNLSLPILGHPSGSDTVRLLSSGGFDFVNGSLANLVTIDNSGNVGIGTSSPVTKLYIKGVVNYDGVITADNSSTTGGGIFQIRQNGVVAGTLTVEGSVLGNSSTNLALFAETGNEITFFTNGLPTERMRIDSSGNVGIGTSSITSGFKLDAVGNIKAGLALSLGQSGGNYDGVGYNVGFTGTTGNWNYIRTDTASLLEFTAGGFTFLSAPIGTAGTSLTLTERMRIDSSGNVGIGTTSPAVKLDVVGNSAAVQVSESGGASARIVAGGSSAFLGTYSNHPLLFLTDSTERMRIDSSGNVGIGTTSPTEKLDVNGNIKTASPSGGTAKPFKIGEVETPGAGYQYGGKTLKVEIDGVVYRLMIAEDIG